MLTMALVQADIKLPFGKVESVKPNKGLLSSHHLKFGKALGVLIGHFHLLYIGSGRALVAPADHFGDVGFGSFKHRFHFAVVEIANPSFDF